MPHSIDFLKMNGGLSLAYSAGILKHGLAYARSFLRIFFFNLLARFYTKITESKNKNISLRHPYVTHFRGVLSLPRADVSRISTERCAKSCVYVHFSTFLILHPTWDGLSILATGSVRLFDAGLWASNAAVGVGAANAVFACLAGFLDRLR
jgi:hypothetical protein